MGELKKEALKTKTKTYIILIRINKNIFFVQRIFYIFIRLLKKKSVFFFLFMRYSKQSKLNSGSFLESDY